MARPCACSGETYWAVPTTMPVRVSGTAEAALAMPKSVTLTTPSAVTMRLPGLMSRWISPRLWMACRPTAAWAIRSSAMTSGRVRCRARMSARDSPWTYSMTMKQ